MAHFCSNCGTAVKENAKFCPQCGAPLANGETGTPAADTQPAAYTQSAVNTQPENGNMARTAENTARPAASAAGEAPQSAAAAPRRPAPAPRPAPSYEKSGEQELKEKFFTYEGRLSRNTFIKRSLVVGGIWFISAILSEFDSTAVLLLSLALSIGVIVSGFMLEIRRLHDIGKGGINVLWGFVPIANLILFYWLFIKKGDPYANRFGEVPVD
jgi:uncharacterized membrane protein YhaH (DUF805 family)